MFVAERFLSGVVREYGKHACIQYRQMVKEGTWYPMACRFLKLKHHIHSPYEKDIIIEKEQCSISRIEQNALMTTFHVEKRTAN